MVGACPHNQATPVNGPPRRFRLLRRTHACPTTWRRGCGGANGIEKDARSVRVSPRRCTLALLVVVLHTANHVAACASTCSSSIAGEAHGSVCLALSVVCVRRGCALGEGVRAARAHRKEQERAPNAHVANSQLQGSVCCCSVCCVVCCVCVCVCVCVMWWWARVRVCACVCVGGWVWVCVSFTHHPVLAARDHTLGLDPHHLGRRHRTRQVRVLAQVLKVPAADGDPRLRCACACVCVRTVRVSGVCASARKTRASSRVARVQLGCGALSGAARQT